MAASTSETLTPRRATYQDVLDAPAHRVAEIVDGTLHAHPRPAPAHAVASSALGGELANPFHFGRDGLHGKRPIYAREGVAHLWFVDPEDRTLEAFELRKGQWMPIASAKHDEPVRIRPFDAITFSLADLRP